MGEMHEDVGHDPGFAVQAHFGRRRALFAALKRGDERAKIGAVLAGIETLESPAARRERIREVLPDLLERVPALRAIMPGVSQEAQAAPDYDRAYSDRVIAVLTQAVAERADGIAPEPNLVPSDGLGETDDAS